MKGKEGDVSVDDMDSRSIVIDCPICVLYDLRFYQGREVTVEEWAFGSLMRVHFDGAWGH